MSSNGINIENIYTSASCNRKPQAFDLISSILLYPSCKSICVYDIVNRKHLNIINAHDGQVHSVRWIKEDAFITCSDDHSSKIWTIGTNNFPEFMTSYKLIGHNDEVIACDCVFSYLLSNAGSFISCTSSNDQQIILWSNDEILEKINIKNYVFCIKMIYEKRFNEDNSIIIAFGGSDHQVHLICLDKNRQIHNLLNLSAHQNWVRSVDMIFTLPDTLFLTSSSQDNAIKVWKMKKRKNDELKINDKIFFIDLNEYFITLETVLIGHEDWVYSVKFLKKKGEYVRILSSSMDKSLILWSQPKDSDNDLWFEEFRVGNIGGNNLGFIGGLLNEDQMILLGQSFTKTIHFWSYEKNCWCAKTPITGHSLSVSAISWASDGSYLLSCSYDQTTRLHCKQINDNGKEFWHELARPQIHGYDLNCLTSIDPLTFASGADEKIIRIFKATKCFVQSMKNLAQIDFMKKENEDLAEFARMQPLGLSTKAMFKEDEEDEYFKPVVLTQPPSEEMLMQNLLWPEIHKLFGHGYELFSLTCNHKASLLVSACKANKSDHASLIIWSIQDNFKILQHLTCHQLTVTQIKFSPDDNYLVSVSRDRTWALYKVNQDCKLIIIGHSNKNNGIHSRIIWDVSWTLDSNFFITVSRDQKAVFWEKKNWDNFCESSDSSLGPVQVSNNGILQMEESINCVDIAPKIIHNSFIIAFGLENGLIHLKLWKQISGFKPLSTIANFHVLPVKSIRFKPLRKNDENLLLASCAEDGKVALFSIQV